jgi:hypothetical protein
MVTTVTLNDGIEIPQVGFGVFQIPLEETDAAVTTALAEGYSPHRHRAGLSERGGRRAGGREVRGPT